MNAQALELTKEKTVFYQKLNGKFDTPKKLNRSTKTVPSTFVDSVESGNITSEQIKEIEKSFPVFTYQSCITIHGELPKIERNYVGGYKNIIQNKNGSVEIRWSAIDYAQKREISNLLRLSTNWAIQENSTNGIYFENNYRTTDKVEANRILHQLKAEAEKLNIDGLTAKIFVQGFVYFGMYYISKVIMPYSITKDALFIASQLTGLSEAELLSKQAQKDAEAKQREQQIKDAQQNRELILQQAIKQVSHLKKEKITGEIGLIYIKPVVATNNAPAFRFYKISEKGTFGRVKVETYLSQSNIVDQTKFEAYLKGKQVKPSEISQLELYRLN